MFLSIGYQLAAMLASDGGAIVKMSSTAGVGGALGIAATSPASTQ